MRGAEESAAIRAQPSEALYKAIFQSTANAVIVTDPVPEIIAVNPAFTEITGWSADDALGHNPSILSSGRHERQFYREMWRRLLSDGRWSGELWNRRRNGEIYPQWLSIDVVRNEFGTVTNYVCIFHDITDRKRQEQTLEWQALHDALTGLPNRVLMADRLSLALERARRDDQLIGVLALDLDGFKAVNDRYGHAAGDELLKQASQRISSCVRSCDTVARLGGDEFIVLCPDVGSPRTGTVVADRILRALGTPFALEAEGVVAQVSASIGVAFYPMHGGSGEVLLRRADSAMYMAKQEGKACVQLAA